MKTQVEGYAIYRKFNGFLCHCGFHYDDLGWFQLDEMVKEGASIVWFKSRGEATNWATRLPMSKKGWFGQCQWSIKKLRFTIETEAEYVWD